MTAISLPDLFDIDRQRKPSGADNEWRELLAYYEDQGRDLTSSRLKELGVGLPSNRRPLEVNLLRRIIDRIAVIYDRAPSRWLLSERGERLAESDPEHGLMLDLYARSQMDLAWRRVDRLRALLRQAGIRYYPSPARGSVVARIFTPDTILRLPSPHAPDQIEYDQAFALQLDGKIWELWNRTDGGWAMAWVDESGAPVDGQPFALTGGALPYSELPVQLVFDDYSGGRAWLAPRCSRVAWTDAVNAISNDLWSLIVHQAHTSRFFRTDNPDGVPRKQGPGIAAVVPKDTEIEDLSPNPKIQECERVLESFIRLWTHSEDLPANEFDRSKQVVTGATLKVQERPLNARREAQIPLALEDERAAWRKFRAVHNYHAAEWGKLELDSGTELEVEIAELVQPMDGRELQETMARAIALGSASVIDLIQREQNVPRHHAIQIYERVKKDREIYPPHTAPAELAGDGKKLSRVAEDAALGGKASIVDAIESAPVN